MHSRLLFCLLLCFAATGQGQSPSTTATQRFEFLPGGLLFAPLSANVQEPRMGLRKELGSSRMKLDIGATLDLLQVSFDPAGHSRLRLGAELFTYALTTSAQGLRLQVDAVDGFFGGHIVFRRDLGPDVLSLRLRLLHLSAHLVDGHFSLSTGEWRDNRLPLPFTRDFGELLAAYTFPAAGMPLTLYSGLSYAAFVRPALIKRLGTLHGIEVNTADRLGTLFGKTSELYLACHLTVAGVPAYTGTTVAEAGIKLGAWEGSGVRVYVNYASGLDFFSEYYDERRAMWGAGFAFDIR